MRRGDTVIVPFMMTKICFQRSLSIVCAKNANTEKKFGVHCNKSHSSLSSTNDRHLVGQPSQNGRILCFCLTFMIINEESLSFGL